MNAAITRPVVTSMVSKGALVDISEQALKNKRKAESQEIKLDVRSSDSSGSSGKHGKLGVKEPLKHMML